MSESVKGEVREIDPEWIVGLMQKGLIVKLTISRWSGCAKLYPEDLGLQSVDSDAYNFTKDYISLGSQKLLPPTVLADFKKLEQKARSLLKTHSFNTIWGRFIPETALLEWEEKNEEIRKEYMNAAKNFGNQYNEIVAMVREDYRNLAKDVWARLYPENKDGITKSFEEHFVQSIIDKIPPREDIVSKFGYKNVFFEVPVPSIVASNLSKAGKIARENELKNAEHQVLLSSKQRLSEIYIEKRKEYIDSFLDTTVKSLRRNIAELCDNILKGIGQRKVMNKGITGKQVQRIKNIVKLTENFNFYDDKEIEDLLKELDRETDKTRDCINNDILEDRLEKIVKITKEEFIVKDFNPAIFDLEI